MINPSKKRMILFLSLILLTAFLTISLLNYVTSKTSLEEEIIRNSMPLLRESIYSSILHDLLPAMHTASLMANDNFLVGWIQSGEEDIDAISAYLGRIASEYNFITAFFVSEVSRNYYHSEGIHKVIAPENKHDVWYFDFLKSRKNFDLDVDTNEAANDVLTIFVNYRLENRLGELLGVTGVGLEMRGFSGFLAEQQSLFERQIYLVDESGAVQAHSDMRIIETDNIREAEGLSEVADDILVKTDHPFSGRYGPVGNRTIITSRYIPEIDWFLIVEHSEKELMADVRLHLLQSLVIGLIAFILVLALSLVTLRGYDKRLEAIAISDALTGIANRRALEAALPRMLFRRKRFDSALTLLMIDFDGFKALNDSYGHQSGDAALVSFAGVASAAVHPDDLLVRWGGDEFVIVVENEIEEAEDVAESIRRAYGEIETRISLSIGVAEASADDDADSLVRKADMALYQAKEQGRNRTCRHLA